MKTILALILFLPFFTFAQQEQRQFGIAEVFRSGDSIFIKKLVTQVVNVSEGTVTKMRTPPDTAILFLSSDGDVYEGMMTWKKVGGTVTETIIDGVTTNPANQYSGVWTHRTGAPWTQVFEGQSASFSEETGATLKISFTGNRVQWLSEKSNNKGKADVIIDAGTEAEVKVEIDLYAPGSVNNKTIVFDKELTQGPHTITIRVKGEKNTSSTGVSVLHDAIKVFSR